MFITITTVVLTALAFLLSTYFVLTWGWGIIKAKRRGEAHVSWVGALDYAGLQVMVLLYTGLALESFIEVGVPPAMDWNAMVRRTILYLLLVLVAGIRTARWVLRQGPRWARPMIRYYDRWYHRRAVRRMIDAARR